MNFDSVKSKFSNEALSIIEAEVRSSAEATFSVLDMGESTHIIEPFYVQPLFYATLLNYYTMHQQHSTVSLLEIASSPDASESDKDAVAQSFAAELGLDLTGQTVANKLSIINSALTSSDSRIKKLQAAVRTSYDQAEIVVSGSSREMFRNSPDHKMFADTRFAIPYLYENMSSAVTSPSIQNQAISIADANRYKNMSHSGRSGNSADIFLSPTIETSQHTLSSSEGVTEELILEAKKYAYFTFQGLSGDEDIRFEFSDVLNIGFETRGITFTSTGPCAVTIDAHYYIDDVSNEAIIKNQFPTLDITFSGKVPIFIDLVLQNDSSLESFMNTMKDGGTTKSWMALFRSESSKLTHFGNKSIEMTGEMMVSPLVSRPVAFFNGNIAISGNSIMSWVSESNSCIIPRKVTVLETGNVTLF